jgi:hypothetical protein
VRKWCPLTILGWWWRSNSGNVGPVQEYISISSDSTNNSSDSFITIDFCRWKDMRRARNAFRWAFETISQFTNLTPPTMKDMWCETPTILVGYHLSPCHQAHGLNFTVYLSSHQTKPSNYKPIERRQTVIDWLLWWTDHRLEPMFALCFQRIIRSLKETN